MKRNILKLFVISYAFPPQHNPESILIAKFLKGLVRQNILPVDPVVVCAEAASTLESRDAQLSKLLPHNLIVEKLPSPERQWLYRTLSLFFPFLKKLPDKSIWWVIANRKTILALCQKHSPSAIYSHSHYLGSHLLALKVKNATGLPWIAHFSDPWVGNPYAPYGILTKTINLRWERQVLERADCLVFVSAQLRDFMLWRYPRAWKAKSLVVPHPYDPALYKNMKRKITGDSSEKFIISHIGNFYGRRSPDPFLKALSHIQQKHPEVYANLAVQFIGSLPLIQKLSPLFRAHAAVIRHIPPVSYLKSLQRMQAADMLLLIDADFRPSPFLPSKLIDYLGTGKPILGITPEESPSEKLLLSLGNPSVPPQEVGGIAAACVQLFHNRQKRKRSAYSASSLRPYHIDTVAGQVAKRLKGLL